MWRRCWPTRTASSAGIPAIDPVRAAARRGSGCGTPGTSSRVVRRPTMQVARNAGARPTLALARQTAAPDGAGWCFQLGCVSPEPRSLELYLTYAPMGGVLSRRQVVGGSRAYLGKPSLAALRRTPRAALLTLTAAAIALSPAVTDLSDLTRHRARMVLDRLIAPGGRRWRRELKREQ